MKETTTVAAAPPAPASLDLGPFRRASQWRPLEYIFWVIPIAAYFLFGDDLLLMSQIAIMCLFALSLDLILGYAGILSLGHAAFFGLGAYTAGLLAKYGMGDPLIGLGLAALVAGLGGFLSSFLVLRGNDLTRLLVTLGVSLMLFELANKLTDFTGGVDGLQGVEVQPLFGLYGFDMFGRTGYIYSVVVLFIMFWFARRLVHAPLGQSLRGIHQNGLRMPALGVPVNRRLVLVYTIGAVYAGVAGALLTQTNSFVSLDVLSFQRSADLMIILVLGGTGRLYGALIGSIVFMVAHHYLAGINPQYWQFWLGLFLVLIVLFARDGILGGAERLIAWVRHKSSGQKTAAQTEGAR